MLDVSDAVDLLFTGVTPERVTELKSLWGEHENRVRLLPADGFLLQQLPGAGVIQVNEIALRQIWLTGYAAWDGVDAYSAVIAQLLLSNRPFDPVSLRALDKQIDRDAKFDRAVDRVRELGSHISIDDFPWPEDVPKPIVGLKIEDTTKKAVFDLVCMAGAFVFLHEIRHGLLDEVEDRPAEQIEEERECDRFARSFLTDEIPAYSAESGYPAKQVRAKRLLGVIIGLCVVLIITPRENWRGTSSHPSVRERIEAVLKSDVTEEMSDTFFWSTCASMLAAFARHFGVLSGPIPFSSFRELALQMCERLT